MTEREKELKELIKSIVDEDLKNLWINHREKSTKKNGFVNMALVQKTKKIINEKIKEFERGF